jgi:branched-chain amino acid transport system permease protein
MQILIQQIANGLMLGSTYALIALGLTLIYGIMHIPNFALAHQGMVAAFVTYFLMVSMHFNYWPAMVVSILSACLLGIIIERGIFHPLRKSPHVNFFISALGLMLILENSVLIIAGGSQKKMEAGYGEVLTIFGFTTTGQRLLVIFVGVLLLAACYLLIKKNKYGIAIAATAQEPDGAQLVGINTSRVHMMTFAIGSGLSAVAINLVGPIYLISPSMGHGPIAKAFVVVILGGMGSIPGAVMGGYLLGLLESLGAGYISSDFADLFSFLVLVVVLYFKPTGFFGEKQ